MAWARSRPSNLPNTETSREGFPSHLGLESSFGSSTATCFLRQKRSLPSHQQGYSPWNRDNDKCRKKDIASGTETKHSHTYSQDNRGRVHMLVHHIDECLSSFCGMKCLTSAIAICQEAKRLQYRNTLLLVHRGTRNGIKKNLDPIQLDKCCLGRIKAGTCNTDQYTFTPYGRAPATAVWEELLI